MMVLGPRLLCALSDGLLHKMCKPKLAHMPGGALALLGNDKEIFHRERIFCATIHSDAEEGDPSQREKWKMYFFRGNQSLLL